VRDRRLYEAVGAALSASDVQQRLAHVLKGQVRRYTLPGIAAYNFVATRALGGGGASSIQVDRQAKAFAVQLLSTQLLVPKRLLQSSLPRPSL